VASRFFRSFEVGAQRFRQANFSIGSLQAILAEPPSLTRRTWRARGSALTRAQAVLYWLGSTMAVACLVSLLFETRRWSLIGQLDFGWMFSGFLIGRLVSAVIGMGLLVFWRRRRSAV
jgi:hypothetical protein